MPSSDSSSSRYPSVQAFSLVGSVRATVIIVSYGIVALSFGLTSTWFTVFLILLGFNLAGAVVNRMPLKRSQWPFVVVHAALISLLLGLWISHHYGFEGELVVSEGEDTSALRLFEHEMVLSQSLGNVKGVSEHVHALKQFALPEGEDLAGYEIQKQTATQPGIEITDVMADGLIATSIIPARDGVGPGLEFEISGRGIVVPGWLLADHPDHRQVDFGPVVVEILNFRRQDDFDFQAQASQASYGISIESIGATELLHIPLPGDIGRSFDAGHGVEVVVQSYVEHARVDGGRLLDFPNAPANPAAEVLITSGDQSERHIIFSLFPDFSIHELGGQAPLSQSIRLDAAHSLQKPLLSLLCDPSGRLHTQVTLADGRTAAVPLPQEDFTVVEGTPCTFTLKRFLSNASFTTDVHEAQAGIETGTDLVKVLVTFGAAKSEFWMKLGDAISVPLLGNGRSLHYQRKEKELPFRLGLEALNIGYFVNSRKVKDVTCEVLLAASDGSSEASSMVITQNQPLDYMGYRLLQSRIEAGSDGSPSTTVLSISYDPGVPLLYASFILLILGVGWYVLSEGPASRKNRHSGPSADAVGHIEMVLNPQELVGGGETGPNADVASEPVEGQADPSLKPAEPIEAAPRRPQTAQ